MRKTILILAVTALAVLSMSCNQLRARDQLNKGVQAFTNAQYPEAVERFKTACELDPGFAAARLYLATAYMQQFIPGSDSAENNKMAQAAQDNFLKVLEQERTRWERETREKADQEREERQRVQELQRRQQRGF